MLRTFVTLQFVFCVVDRLDKLVRIYKHLFFVANEDMTWSAVVSSFDPRF
jgi:hypothetical protein